MRRLPIALVALIIGLGVSARGSADEMKLVFTTIALPTAAVSEKIYHPWAERVNEAGKGIVHIDVRDGTTLANSTNFYDRLLSDVMQVSFGSLNYLAGKFKLSQVMALPFLMDSAEQESVVFWRLYKSGLLDSEFDQIVPVFIRAFPQQSLHLVKAPTKPIEDLSNLKIIASGQIGTALMAKLGAAPLSIQLTDTYEALQRGTADGVNFPVSSLPDFKLDEVTHYHIDVPLGGGPGGIWMAKAKYESLPPEVRKVFDANSGQAESRRAGIILDQLQTSVQLQLAAEPNQQIVKLSPGLLAKWKPRIDALVNAWADADDAHRRVVDAVRELATHFSAAQ